MTDEQAVDLSGFSISVQRSDSYVNATLLCSKYNAQYEHWETMPKTAQFLAAFEEYMFQNLFNVENQAFLGKLIDSLRKKSGIEMKENETSREFITRCDPKIVREHIKTLAIVVKTYEGTFIWWKMVHPLVAINIASWINITFNIYITMWAYNLMKNQIIAIKDTEIQAIKDNLERIKKQLSDPNIGHLYCLSNPCFPQLIKVCLTEKNVEVRANQLYTTGVPEPFNIIHVAKMKKENLHQRESEMFKILDKWRYNQSREFFTRTDEVMKLIVENFQRIEQEEGFTLTTASEAAQAQA